MSNANKWLSDLKCADRESLSWNKILAGIYDVKQSPSELCQIFKKLAMFGDTSHSGVWVDYTLAKTQPISAFCILGGLE